MRTTMIAMMAAFALAGYQMPAVAKTDAHQAVRVMASEATGVDNARMIAQGAGEATGVDNARRVASEQTGVDNSRLMAQGESTGVDNSRIRSY